MVKVVGKLILPGYASLPATPSAGEVAVGANDLSNFYINSGDGGGVHRINPEAQGIWIPSVPYIRGDLVSYMGDLYWCRANVNSATTPLADTTNWMRSTYANPMTAAEDVIKGGTSGVPTRQAKGGNDTYLGVSRGGAIAYSTPPTNPFLATFTFSNTTTLAEPATGTIRLNNATQNLSTILMLPAGDLHGYSVSAIYDPLFQTPWPTTRGFVRITSRATPINWLQFRAYAYQALGAAGRRFDLGLPVATSASPIANGEEVDVTFVPIGFDSPMAAVGDMINGGTGGVPTRLVVGNQRETILISSGLTQVYAPFDQMNHPIVNSNMDIWNEGNGLTGVVDGQILAECFEFSKAAGATGLHNVIRSGAVPPFGIGMTAYGVYSIQSGVTTADTSIAAGDYYAIRHRMEGWIWRNFHTRVFTLSFWTANSVVGTHCVYFKNAGDDRTYVAEYTINVANTWEWKSITVAASPTAGTWNVGLGRGIEIGWVMAAGSTFHTTKDAWQTGNFKATSSQVNGVGTVNNGFYLFGPTLRIGTQGAAYVHPDPVMNKLATERYCQKSYDQETPPGSIGGGHVDWAGAGIAASSAGATAMSTAPYLGTGMRTTPITVLYSPSSGAANAIWDVATGTRTGVTATGPTERMPWNYFTFDASSAVAIAVGHQLQMHWICRSRVP